VDERLVKARELYEDAVFRGEPDAIGAAHTQLDAVEADLVLARGRLLHAQFLRDRVEDPAELTNFERALELYQRLGDARGEAEAHFLVGIYHQVVRHDQETGLPSLLRSYELAVQIDDKLTRSYAVRHLGFVDQAAGRPDAARAKLEESVELRREIGFRPGVAAGVLALAQLAAEEGRRDDAVALLDEASQVATESGANGIMPWIEETRAELNL
jgi:tetratricopeptide (TPR) repeat protein